MLVFGEPAIDAIYLFAALTGLFTLALILFALIRRRTHRKYYERLDRLRQESQRLLDGMLAGSVAYDGGLAALRAHFGAGGAGMLERVLAEAGAGATGGSITILRRVSADLGFIRAWQKRLAASRPIYGRGFRLWSALRRLRPWADFPARARATEYLGVVHHRPSWRLMVRALRDPSSDVRNAAVRALGALGEPRAFPILLTELKDAATSAHPRCSAATLRRALARFPLRLAGAVLPLLSDPDARVRFLGAEVLQEMTQNSAAAMAFPQLSAGIFPGEVLQACVVDVVRDPSANVRARAAMILGYVADSRAHAAIVGLLEDGDWFVRLQAVKSAGRSGDPRLEDRIAERLPDREWRVREAAAHALARSSRRGVSLLLSQFLDTQDVYMKEQIAEEAERSGLVARWVQHFGEAGFERETQALSQLVAMGKTALLHELLGKSSSDGHGHALLEMLGRHREEPEGRHKGHAAGR